MTEHTPTPWRYDEFLACLIEGDNGAPIRGPANAAFIVKAVNNHNEAIGFLELASKSLWNLGDQAVAHEIDRFLGRVGGVRHD